MKKKCMLFFVFSLLFLNFFVVNISAQQHHFIYIQADNQQPFYVILDNKTYSSSPIGHIIIPKLTDGQYDLKIGFAKDTFPEQKFTAAIDKKDAGYQLKNLGDKGWALFNLETLQLVMAGEVEKLPVQDTSKTETVKTNAFGNMLSDVVSDSTLTQQTKATNNSVAATSTLQDSSITQSTTTKGIIKASEEAVADGTNLVFIDFNNASGDTIRAFIPANNTVENNTLIQTAASNIDSSSLTNNSIVASNQTSLNNNEIAVNDTTKKEINNPFYSSKDTSVNNMNAAINNTKPFNNSNCTNMADENDLSKLRKKMIAESDPDKMIQIVKKSLKGKCLITDQVKNLGALFLSDESRYNFFDAIYNSVYDFGKYPSLESQLIDNYYKKRFEAMLR